MNTKYDKLVSLRKAAIAKNEDMLINVYGMLLDRMITTISDEGFDMLLVAFLKERAVLATTFLKKGEDKLSYKEVYCINLLNSTFLNGEHKLVVNGKKITFENE